MNRITRLFPIAASLLGVALMTGCSDVATAPSGPEFAINRPERLVSGEITICRPQAYAASSAWIGPRGGILKAGNAQFWVPAGALKDSVFITMATPYGSMNRAVFQPEGLTFNTRFLPHLVMSYAGCAVSPGTSQQIASLDEVTGSLEATASSTDPLNMTVDGVLRRLSDYVLLSTYAVVY